MMEKDEGGMLLNKGTDTIVQNLRDAGCSDETISDFLRDLRGGKTAEGLKLLAAHRRVLLNRLHEEQKQIDCLDYLVWQMEKPKEKRKSAFRLLTDSPQQRKKR